MSGRRLPLEQGLWPAGAGFLGARVPKMLLDGRELMEGRREQESLPRPSQNPTTHSSSRLPGRSVSPLSPQRVGPLGAENRGLVRAGSGHEGQGSGWGQGVGEGEGEEGGGQGRSADRRKPGGAGPGTAVPFPSQMGPALHLRASVPLGHARG